jgi:hypothetical protein
MAYRALDPVYLNAYPRGQIEIAVYTRDASTVTEWITKHSGPPPSTNQSRYWSPVKNSATATVAGHTGVSFDWIPDQKDKTVHATALFIGASSVLVIQWWSTDSTYSATLLQYYQQMLGDLQA